MVYWYSAVVEPLCTKGCNIRKRGVNIIMKFIYPAVIRKTEEGKYQASFPDLECCYATGDTLEEAVDNANEAAYDWLYLEISEGRNRTLETAR